MSGTVFVTGGTGNAGGVVIAELVRRGVGVVALARSARSLPGCRVVVGDLCDLSSARDELAAADAVIHLASPRSNDPDTVLNEDIVGTCQLLDGWSRGPFIYTSSQTVYGVPSSPLTE